MCSIQGERLAEGFGSHQPFLLFVFYNVALCPPGAILRGLVAVILRRSSISIIVSMLYVYIYIYLYLVYSLVADDVPRHLGLLMFVADDLPYLL